MTNLITYFQSNPQAYADLIYWAFIPAIVLGMIALLASLKAPKHGSYLALLSSLIAVCVSGLIAFAPPVARPFLPSHCIWVTNVFFFVMSMSSVVLSSQKTPKN